MKNLFLSLATLASLAAPTMGVMSVRLYNERTNFYRNWQDGIHLKTYRMRNPISILPSGDTKGLNNRTGELRGGLRTCLAVVAATPYLQNCDRFDLSLLR